MQKLILSILCFIGFISQSYSQETLIGNWHRVVPSLKNQDLKSKKLQPYDLQIFADSTFHIQGDSSTLNSKIPGWHAGEDEKGKMEVTNNYIVLNTDPNSKISLALKILMLTKEKLILRISDTGPDMIYVRF